MVTLFTWYPIQSPGHPDLGHSAMSVEDGSQTLAYVSFWPEPDTLAGEIGHFFRPAPSRFPQTYQAEIDPASTYMMRPADESDMIAGLDEAKLIVAWQSVMDSRFDILHWNCSDVTKYCFLHALDKQYHDRMVRITGLTLEDLRMIGTVQEFRGLVRYLATRRFIDSRPQDIAFLVRKYNALRAAEQEP
jgi:hypothetical protein